MIIRPNPVSSGVVSFINEQRHWFKGENSPELTKMSAFRSSEISSQNFYRGIEPPVLIGTKAIIREAPREDFPHGTRQHRAGELIPDGRSIYNLVWLVRSP